MSAPAMLDRPACMSQAEFDEWLDAAQSYSDMMNRGRDYRIGIRPCADCTRDFAAKMQGEDRCNGVPGRYTDMDRDERRRYNMFQNQRARARAAA